MDHLERQALYILEHTPPGHVDHDRAIVVLFRLLLGETPIAYDIEQVKACHNNLVQLEQRR